VRPDVVRNLDYVTVVAPAQVEFFEQFLPRERVQVILHGVDTTFFRPSARRSRGTDFLCLTVGHYLRDFIAVRRVAELLAGERDVRFHIVTGFETGLEDLPNVTVHRGLSDHALLWLYQTADVLFLPLLDCTANNALLEGLASGLPVVTTDLASVRAYAPGGEVICVRENNPDELAEAIRQLRRCPALRERMAQAARGRAEQLSWAEIARAYERLYSDALSAGRQYPS
jgi:glycosyltransferase involved in cell wall biosynthesis